MITIIESRFAYIIYYCFTQCNASNIARCAVAMYATLADCLCIGYSLPPTKERYVFSPAFVGPLARLLKNACMDLDEMLHVNRCRDTDELINF